MKGNLVIHPPFHEMTFEATRSGGAGGQHVNRTDSTVILRWNPSQSESFDEFQKTLILEFLKKQLTVDGDLLIRSSEERSQKQNKELCIKKWIALIVKALTPRKKRIKTQPTYHSKVKRVNEKKKRSLTKQLRGKINETED